jgi:hypothetical protein
MSKLPFTEPTMDSTQTTNMNVVCVCVCVCVCGVCVVCDI